MKIKTASRIGAVKEYYFATKLREIAQLRAQGVDIISLAIGSPDQMPAPEVIRALSLAADQPQNHGYQSYSGIPELRLAFAQWYHRVFEVQLDHEQEVLPLIGSKEGIMHISMTYLEAGDQVLVPNPGYPSYSAAARLTGAEVRYYDLTASGKWQPDLQALAATDLSKVKIMWINYPHMPTGANTDLNVFKKMVAFAAQHNILLCHDNPYAFILNDQPASLFQIEGAKDVALELNSMSKTFNMAGWRIGMLAGHPDRIREVLRFKSNMDSGMYRPLQLAAVAALNLPQDWYENINKLYKGRRSMAEAILIEWGCTFDPKQVGMFLWGRIPKQYKDGIDLADRVLDEAHVFITPGSVFGSNGDQYIRISLCSPVAKFEKALDRCKNMNVAKKIKA